MWLTVTDVAVNVKNNVRGYFSFCAIFKFFLCVFYTGTQQMLYHLDNVKINAKKLGVKYPAAISLQN